MKEAEKAKANEVKMSVTETGMRIRKVVLNSLGTEGLTVTYGTTEIRNQISSPIEYEKTNSRPVQKELRMLFDDLKIHLLRCLGYHWSNDTVLEMYKANITASYVLTKDADKFMIGGKNKVKEHSTAVNSPLFDVDNYDEWDELRSIIEDIKKEAKLFMNGLKGADNRTIAIDYMKAKKDITDAEKSFDDMSEEEREIIISEAFGYNNLEVLEEDGKQVIGADKDDLIPVVEADVPIVGEESPFIEGTVQEENAKANKKAPAKKKEKDPTKEQYQVKEKMAPLPKAVVEPVADEPTFVVDEDDDIPLFVE